MSRFAPFAGFFTRKRLLIAAGILLLYAISGFLVLPLLIKSILLSSIPEQLGRTARVETVRFNPFVLSVTLRGFEIDETDGKPFAGFDELYINFQLSSIFRAAYTFNEIRLLAPRGQVKILPDGNFNFSDLLASRQPTEPAADDSSPAPALIVYSLQIEKGHVGFTDLSKPTPFETILFPITLSLENFSTRLDKDNPYAFTATTGEGERLSWEGRFSFDPFRSEGRFALTGVKKRTLWKYIQHQVLFEVTGGTLDLGARYSLDTGADPVQIRLTEGEVKIQDFTLTKKDKDQILIAIPFFHLKGADIHISKNQVQVASVLSRDARFEAWLEPDGQMNYQTLFAVDHPETSEEAPDPAPENKKGGGLPWQINIRDLKLENYSVALENRSLAKPPRVELEPIDLNLTNLSNQKDSRTEATLTLKINQTGTVTVKGEAGMNPLLADLAVQVGTLDLKPFQPYLDAVTQVELVSGMAGLDGRLSFGIEDKDSPEMRFKGNVNLDTFKVVDRLHGEDLARWDAIHFRGMTFDVDPYQLHISEIIARKPYAKVTIWPDKTVNVTNAFSAKTDKPTDDAVFLAARPAKAVSTAAEGPMPITIDTVRMEKGFVQFTDMSLQPNVVTGIQDLNGTVKGLTSETLGRADVLLAGQIDQYAPVKISGQINPLSDEAYTDLVLTFKNIGLTTATPYSGKYIGHAIEKGKLSLDLRYKLSKNILIGENKILLDQFTFGDRVDSPDATKLPVKLAVAMLKDRKGVIDLDLPVRGDLNDPEFTYGRIVLKALTNLITSIAASPFAALGKIVGMDGEEMSFVAFDFGDATIQPAQDTKLRKLAQALNERPSLRLDIKGFADANADLTALAENKLLLQLKEAKRNEMQADGLTVPARLEDLTLSEDEYNGMLIRAYEDRFGQHPRTLLSEEQKLSDDQTHIPIFVSKARQRLIQDVSVSQTALRELARNRAMQIKKVLVQEGGIRDEQVFLADIEIADGSGGDSVHTQLTLTGK